MKKVKKIIHIKLTLITLVFLPIAVFTLITSQTTIIKNVRSFVVMTASMQPNIPQGSIIYTQKQNKYKKGDVIAFQLGNSSVVTHRIIQVLKQNDLRFYKTQGDANNTPDNKLVNHNDVLGKSTLSLPYAGKFVLFLKTVPGFITFVILPGTLFILFELWNIKIHMEKEIEKKLTPVKSEVKISV